MFLTSRIKDQAILESDANRNGTLQDALFVSQSESKERPTLSKPGSSCSLANAAISGEKSGGRTRYELAAQFP